MSKHAQVLPFVRTPYNYDTMAASDESGLLCEDPSLAQQHMKEETDINNIVERWTRTGIPPEVNATPQYGDFTGVSDYHSAMNAVIAADQAFMTLDAKTRAKFDNDPAKLLAFLSDEKNREEAIELGLVAKPSMQDLSIGATSAPHDAGAGAPVEKSVKKRSMFQRASNAAPEGGEGDE